MCGVRERGSREFVIAEKFAREAEATMGRMEARVRRGNARWTSWKSGASGGRDAEG